MVAAYQKSTEADAAAAVDAAGDAEQNGPVPAPERGAILKTAGNILENKKQELTAQVTREEGRIYVESDCEVQRAIDVFHYYAQKTRDLGGTVKSSSHRRRYLYTRQEPADITAFITPWNYPIAIPA